MHDAISTREIVHDAPVFRDCADSADLNFSEFGAGSRQRSMPNLVSLVFAMRGPPQVIRVRVARAAIMVRDFMLWAWRRAVERFADNAVHKALNLLSFVSQRYGGIAVDAPLPHYLTLSRSRTRDRAHDRPVAVNDIFRRAGNDAAIFAGIVGGSHGAVPSHCGQGRALFPQRFRPAFHSQIASA